MSWLNRRSSLREEDWNLLDFESSPNEALVVSIGNGQCHSEDNSESEADRGYAPQTNRTTIVGDSDLDQWLTQASNQDIRTDHTTGGSSTINLILASQMSSLDELPFTQRAYSDIMRQMRMHGSIVRAINRNTHCTFSTIPFNWPCGDSIIPSIVYNCRTAASWEGDMALSVTFFPETLTTNAVWYGCDMKEHRTYGHNLTNADIITSRLTNFDGGIFHPLILPIIFAELERERHVSLVRRYLTQLVQRINDLAYPDSSAGHESQAESSQLSDKGSFADRDSCKKLKALLTQLHLYSRPEDCAPIAKPIPNTPTDSNTGHELPRVNIREDTEPAIVLWQNTSFLSNGLQNWKAQLRKMHKEVQDLNDTNFKIGNINHSPEVEIKLSRLRDVGARIKVRIQDLIDEYDENILQCNHITEGLKLATQLELNDIGHKDARTNQDIARVNLKVARMTRLDGSLMRSIATLGMIFLPATFVSTVFSMDFFQWVEEDGKRHELVSSHFWIYIVVAGGLTLLTMSIFYFCVLRAPSVEVDEESEGR
ncbi:hypothetical protein HG530_008070 [Fusarium avenaceum]|nr:hypothetical protein HG530_008070 [Fusarium avenaceum]